MNENDVVRFLRTLGLTPQSQLTPAEIKSAWRKKVNEHHPDKGGDQEKFVEITHAYKMLTDPSYRESEKNHATPPTPDLDFKVQLPVTFEDAFFGRTFSMCFNRLEIKPDFKLVIKDEQEMLYVDVELPQGCAMGQEIIKDGLGLKCNNELGRLVIKVMPQRHPKFQLRHADVYSEELVPLDIMLKGGEIEVNTMYGLKTVKVQPGTAPNSELTIPKCGVGGHGNHIVSVKQQFPNKEELKKDKWSGLNINWDTVQPSSDPDESIDAVFRAIRNQHIAHNKRRKEEEEGL